MVDGSGQQPLDLFGSLNRHQHLVKSGGFREFRTFAHQVETHTRQSTTALLDVWSMVLGNSGMILLALNNIPNRRLHSI